MIGSVKLCWLNIFTAQSQHFEFARKIMRVKRAKRHSTRQIWIRVEEIVTRIFLGILSRWSSSSSSRHERDSRQSCGTRIIIFFSLTHWSFCCISSRRKKSRHSCAPSSFKVFDLRFKLKRSSSSGRPTICWVRTFSLYYIGIYSSSINNGKKHIDREGWDIDSVGKVKMLCVVRAIKKNLLLLRRQNSQIYSTGVIDSVIFAPYKSICIKELMIKPRRPMLCYWKRLFLFINSTRLAGRCVWFANRSIKAEAVDTIKARLFLGHWTSATDSIIAKCIIAICRHTSRSKLGSHQVQLWTGFLRRRMRSSPELKFILMVFCDRKVTLTDTDDRFDREI